MKKKIKMEFTPEEQFHGFLKTSQIFAENAIFDYPLYHTSKLVSTEKLVNISEPTENILGKRMEHFFACYITQFTSEDIIAQNRQIIENKQTLGELDFLLKDSTSEEISHIELIFKFYLFDPDTGTSELDHLIGPNKRDSLNQKLQRLQKRQFPLLFHDATKKLLTPLNIIPEEVVQKMCFKASVFLPKQMETAPFDHINTKAIAGYWIKASEFTFEAFGQNTFFTPSKKYWSVFPERNKIWFSFKEIKQQINTLLHNKFSPLLWLKTPDGKLERLFVVWW